MTDDTPPGWTAAVLVAPVAAALFSGSTAWALAHRPDPTTPANAVTPSSPTTTAVAATDPRVAQLRQQVAARAAQVAALRAQLAELRRPGTATARRESAASAASSSRGSSRGSSSGSSGSSVRAGNRAAVAVPVTPAPPAQATTGASG